MRRAGLLGCLVVAGLTAFALPCSAGAAVGDLTFAGCVAGGGANGCVDPTPGQNPLDLPRSAAVSPDGANVYVTSGISNSITAFTRAADGSLSFLGCIADGGASGCTNPSPGHNPIASPAGVVVSPDGNNVYVASLDANSISRFSRAPDGSLSFVGCSADGGAEGCANPSPGHNPLQLLSGVAISPNGRSLYVASQLANAVSRFNLGPAGGLNYIGCFANAGANGCTDPSPGQSPLSGAFQVVVSPDGASVYAISGLAHSISSFNRAPDGSLAFAGCIADGGANGCADPSPGHAPLGITFGIAISPDGTSVYVASLTADAVSRFTRAADGSIGFAGCIADAGTNDCADPSPGQSPLDGAAGVAVSPDGASVYVASQAANSISDFSRAVDGSLGFAGCIANGGASGCTDPSPGQQPLSSASGVAVSPNGASVYVAGPFADAISLFIRDLFSVNVALAGTGAGSVTGPGIACPGTCADAFALGAPVTLDATPAPGSSFSGWSGSCTGGSSCALTMDANKDVVATFSDITDPQTTKGKGTHGRTTKHSAHFKFSSEPGASFECKVDKKPFKPCASPDKIRHVKLGKHVVEVAAVDEAGNADPTPARWRWRVVRKHH